MNAIVVVDENWGIGKEEGLLFSLPTDMKHFRSLTMGGTVIMGRRTLDSFPGGKPLKGRRNIVITRNHALHMEDVETVDSPEAALALVEGEDPEKVWVIGGGSVYTALVPHCKRVYLTKVDAIGDITNWTVETIAAGILYTDSKLLSKGSGGGPFLLICSGICIGQVVCHDIQPLHLIDHAGVSGV